MDQEMDLMLQGDNAISRCLGIMQEAHLDRVLGKRENDIYWDLNVAWKSALGSGQACAASCATKKGHSSAQQLDLSKKYTLF